MFVARTVYSSVAPGVAAPPPTTTTSLVMPRRCTPPTTTTVGSGPVAGLPSPSVSRSGRSAVPTTAWLLMSVPEGVPAFTRSSKVSTADCPAVSVPAPALGSGGVRSDELMSRPAASGKAPPSGWPTGSPFSRVESAT